VVAQLDLARSYRQIVAHGADIFYRGELGRRLVDAVRSAGGWLSEADLATYQPAWRDTLAIEYRGWQVHCSPPPSSGFQYLE
jgi:gamma-glutamyltranspeptidase / glutathione hydrolase